MKPDVAKLIRHHRRLCGMFADPECVGEVLLVGIAIARAYDLGDPFPITDKTSLKHFRVPVYGDLRVTSDLLAPADDAFFQNRYPDSGWGRVSSVVKYDIPRYVPPQRRMGGYCGRPRVRSEGTCGRPAGNIEYLTDPATGHQQPVGACSQNICKRWLTAAVVRNRLACKENPPPRPEYNTGGVLDRHLHELDWWALYTHFEPKWVPPDAPAHLPRLQLVPSGEDPADSAEPADSVGPTARPVLTIIPGGWPELAKLTPGKHD